VYYTGMETLNRARAVVEKAERELRQLLSEAAAAGEYDSVVTLADWARQLAAFGGQVPSPVNLTAANGVAAVAPRQPAVPAETSSSQRAPKGRSKKKAKRTSRNGDYPKFLREKDELVKIGWSKSEKAPYEHKAPKTVIGLLAQALIRAGRGGRRFSTDEILPLKQSAGDGEVPSYQAYLALAWFRVESLVTQHGRQGYSLPEGINLTDEAERRWGNLPAR
jgi:hypothetical protein